MSIQQTEVERITRKVTSIQRYPDFHGEIQAETSGEVFSFKAYNIKRKPDGNKVYLGIGDTVEFEIEMNESEEKTAKNISIVRKAEKVSIKHRGTITKIEYTPSFNGEILTEDGNQTICFDVTSKSSAEIRLGTGDLVEFDIRKIYGKSTYKAFNISVIGKAAVAPKEEKVLQTDNYDELFKEQRYEEILRTYNDSNELEKLFQKKPQLVLDALAGFLEINEKIELNEFQKSLIEVKSKDELEKFLKEEQMYKLCEETSLTKISQTEFQDFFARKNIIEPFSFRNKTILFLNFKNELTIYIWLLWLIWARKSNNAIECCKAFFSKIEEAFGDEAVNRYVYVIKIYNTFLNQQNINQQNDSKTAFYRKRIGGCLNHKNADVLNEILNLGLENGYEEAKDVRDLLECKNLTVDVAESFLVSSEKQRTELCANIINFLWRQNIRDSEKFISILVSPFVGNDSNNTDDFFMTLKMIINNTGISDFDRDYKIDLLKRYAEDNPNKSDAVKLLLDYASGKSEKSIEAANKALEDIKRIKGEELTQEKQKELYESICNYFIACGHVENTQYEIFDYLEYPVIEQILLDEYRRNDHRFIAATIALLYLYISQKEILKAVYIYTASSYQRKKDKKHKADAEEISDFLKNRTRLWNLKKTTDIDILKTALKVLTIDEFDRFIEWASKTRLRVDKNQIDVKKQPNFGYELFNLVFGTSRSQYDENWKALAFKALSVNAKSGLNSSILASYFCRYGKEAFEQLVISKAQNDRQGNDAAVYYSSLWRGLVSEQYSQNFLQLNLGLIEEAPAAYWNDFYEYAVCKNHVFSKQDFWGEQWCVQTCDMKEFYTALIKRYTEQRETVFLQIAAKLLEESDEIDDPDFKSYYPYCKSVKNKDFIFRMIAGLMQKNKHPEETEMFLSSEIWNCKQQEKTLILTLLNFCKEDKQGLVSCADLTINEYYALKKSFLQIVRNYPDLSNVYGILENLNNKNLGYILMKAVFDIAYENKVLKNLSAIKFFSVDSKDDVVFKSYLRMMITVHKKQLQNPIERGENQYYIYIQNRYHRILTCEILLGEKSTEEIDTQIKELIYSYGHSGNINDNYDRFKKTLFAFLETVESESECRKAVLFGFATYNWSDFCSLIDKYSEESLEKLKDVFEHTRFQEYNQMLLKLFIKKVSYENGATEFVFDNNEDLLRKVKICSPVVDNIIKGLRNGEEDEIKAKVQTIADICQMEEVETKAGKSFQVFCDWVNKQPFEISASSDSDIYTYTLMAMVYSQTTVYYFRKKLLNDEIKLSLNKENAKNPSPVWKKVFEKMNCIRDYYYNLSVFYAKKDERDKASKFYTRFEVLDDEGITFTNVLTEEKDRLSEYLKEPPGNGGKPVKFYADDERDFNIVFPEKHYTAAQGIGLLKINADQEFDNQSEDFDSKKALLKVADKTLSLQEKLMYCKALLCSVSDPEDFRKLSEAVNAKEKSISYNEFLIICASSRISSDRSCSASEKLNMLFVMTEIYKNLLESQKHEEYTENVINEAVSALLEQSALDFDSWIDNFSTENNCDIKRVLENFSALKKDDLLTGLVIGCKKEISTCPTCMQKLKVLEEWKKTNVISTEQTTDYVKSFMDAVDTKIEELSLLPKLVLSVSSDKIEDGKIFYKLENLEQSKASVNLDNVNTEIEATITKSGEKGNTYKGKFNNLIELRPGYACGQFFTVPKEKLPEDQGQEIEVILKIIVDGVVICNNSDSNKTFVKINNETDLSACVGKVEYDYSKPVFSKELAGFGRDDEKETISDILVNPQEKHRKNLLILYGPSRAGKTSLLNYIRNFLISESIPENGAIIHVSIADDNDDYNKSMIDGTALDNLETTEKIMEYLFISPLKIAFSCSQNTQRKKAGNKDLSTETTAEINKILSEKNSVSEKIRIVGDKLSAENHQVWLIFDEFQEVIQKWGSISSELQRLCGIIANKTKGIKLILCGSDELVRLFECGDMALWSNFSTATVEYTCPVKQLNQKDFKAMMNDREVLGDYSVFSDDALNLLHKYTGGNAICGKIFGNEILKEIRDGKYYRRSCVYSSDITRVVYNLLEEKDTGTIHTVLTENTTKNLDAGIEQYLIFIAYVLEKNPGRFAVSFDELKSFFKSEDPKRIKSAMRFLCARGFLDVKNENDYTFSTMFYFDFYKTLAEDWRIDELKRKNETQASASREGFEVSVANYLNGMSAPDATSAMVGIFSRLEEQKDDDGKTVKDKIRSTIAETTNNTTYNTMYDNSTNIEGNVTQNNFNINVQTLNTAFSTLMFPNFGAADFNASEYIEAFSSLPSLPASSLTGNESEEEERKITENIENQITGSVINSALSFADFDDLTVDKKGALLGVDKNRREKFFEKLDAVVGSYNGPLSMAIMIHGIYDVMYRNAIGFINDINNPLQKRQELKEKVNNMDFCPVALLYGKLIENILRNKYTLIYANYIPDATYVPDKRFGVFANQDCAAYASDKSLSIGSYAWPIIRPDDGIADLPNPKEQYNPVINHWQFRRVFVDYTENRKKLSEYSGDESEWTKHAKALEVIRVIRNRSAHALMPITKELFDWLVEVLFKEEEILRIFELSKAKDS
ncbi:MAG: ATP-binding protein [Clostridia bacterium]|nr:ATP-binding protein [Clostridia bacterium]